MTDDERVSASFGGSSDLERGMAVLWGTAPPPSRGRKPGMTVDMIVATAIDIADADGLDALSMRRVADALGVGTMSLYRYVRDKAELHELMLDTVVGEGPPLDTGTGGWRAALERYARESLAGYRRHPWLLRASLTRGLMGPNQTAALDAVLRVVSGIGLGPGEMIAVVASVTGYVRGIAQQLVDSASTERRTGVSDAQFWSDVAPLLDQHLDPERFPALTMLWRDQDADWVEPFEFGLDRLLDGIEALVESRTGTR